MIGLCPYDVNKNYEDIIFCRKIDIPINVENRSVQLENGELIFGVYPKYQYSKKRCPLDLHIVLHGNLIQP